MDSSKKNILLIIPGFFFLEEYQRLLYYNDIPLGTLQISSFLKEKVNVKTAILDLRVEGEKNRDLTENTSKFKEAFLNLLDKYEVQNFQNIGINCYTSFQFLYTERIAKIIKEKYPYINIIVGGYHPSGVPEDFCYKNSPFNYIVRGEAENVLLDLFNSNALDKVYKGNKPQVLNSENLIDINSLPFPDYELYLEQYPYNNKFKFEFFMSRGCPYQCTFCATNYEFRSLKFKNFRNHFGKLCELVEKYNDKNLKIGFADQSFNRVPINEKVLDFILKNEFHERFSFSCQSRVETLSGNLELIKKIRKCRMVVGYGFEAVNKELLIEMHKTNNPHHYIETMKDILNQYKDNNDTYCRLNILCGFPGEEAKTFNETIEFINSYALHENIQISPTLFSNYPNVYVYRNMEYYKKKYGSEFIKGWWRLPSNPLMNSVPEKTSKNYTKKQLIKDYKDKYITILKVSKLNTFSELVSWKRFFNDWYTKL